VKLKRYTKKVNAIFWCKCVILLEFFECLQSIEIVNAA